MEQESTLAIIKPDAVQKGCIGQILSIYERNHLSPVAMRMLTLTRLGAEKFYAEHQGKPFFDRLITFMSSGPLVAIMLTGDQAIQRHRTLMGSTDPAKAAPGTLRALFGEAGERNAVHGSDSYESAMRELMFFEMTSTYHRKDNR